MCGIPSIFVTLNIFYHLWQSSRRYLSNAIGFTCFGVHTRKLLHFRFCSFTVFRPESPVFWTGVSGPWFSSESVFLFSPWRGPEFPAQGAGVSALGRSFRSQGPEFLPELLSSVCCSPPGGGRSFRPQGVGVSAPGRSIRSLGPETPV